MEIAGLEKPTLAMNFPRQADARAATDWTYAPCCRAEPKSFPSTQIDSVVSLVDLHGLGEASRATRNIASARRLPNALHCLNAFERFQRTQKHARADAWALAGDIHHERRAIGKIDIAVAKTEKQRLIASGLASEGMAGGVAGRVRLRFNDDSA